MTDIVEQLRNHHKDIGLPDNVESWLTSAADEIERLRAALREYTCDCENGCQGIRGEVCGHKARATLREGSK